MIGEISLTDLNILTPIEKGKIRQERNRIKKRLHEAASLLYKINYEYATISHLLSVIAGK